MSSAWLTLRTVVNDWRRHLAVLIVLVFGGAIVAAIMGIREAAAREGTSLGVLVPFIIVTSLATVVVLWNLWSVSVENRKRHFGTLRMLGYSRGMLVREVLREATFVGFVSAVFSMVCAPVMLIAFMALFRNAKLDGLPTSAPHWFAVALPATVIIVALSVVSAFRAALGVVQGKSNTRQTRPLTRKGYIGLSVAAVLGVGLIGKQFINASSGQAGVIVTPFFVTIGLMLISPLLGVGFAHGLRALGVRLPGGLGVTSYLVGSAELQRRHTKATLGLMFAVLLGCTLSASLSSLDTNSRLALGEAVKPGFIVTGLDGRDIPAGDVQKICAEPSGQQLCQHKLVKRSIDNNPQKVVLTGSEETWQTFFTPSSAVPELPVNGGPVVDLSKTPYSMVLTRLAAKPDVQVAAEERGYLFFTSMDGVQLPEGLKATPLPQWVQDGPGDTVTMGAGDNQVLPFMSTALLLSAMFALTTSFLRLNAMRSEERTLMRWGLSIRGRFAVFAVNALVPWAVIMTCCVVGAWVVSWSSQRSYQFAQLSQAQMPIPWWYVAWVCGGFAVMLLLPVVQRHVAAAWAEKASQKTLATR